jgi:hypothetical protein
MVLPVKGGNWAVSSLQVGGGGGGLAAAAVAGAQLRDKLA